jgi:hypothetical protein
MLCTAVGYALKKDFIKVLKNRIIIFSTAPKEL